MKKPIYKTITLLVVLTLISFPMIGQAQRNATQGKQQIERLIASLKSKRMDLEREYTNITNTLRRQQQNAGFDNFTKQARLKSGQSEYSEKTLTENEQAILAKVYTKADAIVKKSYAELIKVADDLKRKQLEENSRISRELENISRSL